MEYIDIVDERIIQDGELLDDLANELFNDESNFNNADRTTQMRCYNEYEIYSFLEQALDYLKSCDDRCNECGHKLDDEEYETEYENRGEFWGSPCSECIVTGYNCNNCGNYERF